MADCMEFPNDWAKFLEDYSFMDNKEFYTNGARLIPTFRVEQMMHYYLQKATEDSVVVVHGRWNELSAADYQCSVCGFRFTSADPISMFQYCRCGAKMDGGNEDGVR